MQVTLKTAFSILDGRLSTKTEDVYEMLNYIFSADLYTRQLPTAMKALTKINPRWFAEGVEKIQFLKESNETNDFDELMRIIDLYYNNIMIEIGKISPEEINFLGFKL